MHSSAATNLAAAARKILIAVRLFIIIKTLTVHEVDGLCPLLREFGLVLANILTESDAMLLEEIMIVQCGTVLEMMLPSTHDTILQTSGIWIFPNRQHCSATIVASEHVIGSVVSIRNLNLQQIEAGFIAVRKWPRIVFIGSPLIAVVALFGIGSTTGPTAGSSAAGSTGAGRVWTRGANSIHSGTSLCPKRWDTLCSCASGCLSWRS